MFQLSPVIIKRLTDFCLCTGKMNQKEYESRNQKYGLKMLQQNYNGKVAELFIDYLLGGNNTERIFHVRTQQENKEGMAWDSDLILFDKKWSVKSQDKTSFDCYGEGFVYEKTDTMLSDIHCGVQIRYKIELTGWAWDTDEQKFMNWTDYTKNPECKISFIVKKENLNSDCFGIIDKVSLREFKKKLIPGQIDEKHRIEKSDKFKNKFLKPKE